jgi:hypothetical protein
MTFSALAAVLFGLFVATAASDVYPYIPRQFGGGEPTSIRVVFATDARPAARHLGVSSSTSAYVSAPLELLFESNNSVVVRRVDGHVVEMDKSLIRGSGPADGI